MSYVISGYKPEAFFKYFEEITRIPHGSGNENEIADYIEKFSKNNGIRYKRDEHNNIIMFGEASPGYENKETVLLQGHMDMVCEMNSGCEHDFLKDPLDIYVENGWLKARGTTLGGDDGVAVAMIMALLTDSTVKHPALECLITTEEETGMCGAVGFDCSDIKATKLINLDSELEGELTVGCAGGARVFLNMKFDRIPGQNKCINIEITGLSGGHSGSDIHLPKKNAIVLMGRILKSVYDKTPFNLVDISGGNKDNAIPRECKACIATCAPEEAVLTVKETVKLIEGELSAYDKHFKVRIGRPKNCGEPMVTFKDTKRLLTALTLAPNGVYTYSPHISGLVESSDNIGILKTNRFEFHIDTLCRSSKESLLDALISKFAMLSELIGAECEVRDRYPAWEVIPDSPLQKQYIEAVKKVYGDKLVPHISAIHAGLECGILKKKIPHAIDAISMGPDMKDIHTPNEALSLRSCEDTWKVLCELLRS